MKGDHMNGKILNLNTQLLNSEEAEEVLTKMKNAVAQERFWDLFDFKYRITDEDGNWRKVIDIDKFIDRQIDKFIYNYNIFVSTYKFYRNGAYNHMIGDYETNERMDIKYELYCSLVKYLRRYKFRNEDRYKHQINSFFSYLKKHIKGAITKYLDTIYDYVAKDKYNFKTVSLEGNLELEKEMASYNNVTSIIEDNYSRRVIDNFLETKMGSRDRKIYRQYRVLELKTQDQLADEFNISQQAISKKIHKYDTLIVDLFEAELEPLNQTG